MVTPMRRGLLESFEPRIRDVRENPELEQGFAEWSKQRTHFIQASQQPQTAEFKEGWQKHYFRGIGIEGTVAPEHQSKLELKSFEDRGPAIYPPLPDIKAHGECLEIISALGAESGCRAGDSAHHLFCVPIYSPVRHGGPWPDHRQADVPGVFPKLKHELPLEPFAREWDALRDEPYDGLANEATIAAFADACRRKIRRSQRQIRPANTVGPATEGADADMAGRWELMGSQKPWMRCAACPQSI